MRLIRTRWPQAALALAALVACGGGRTIDAPPPPPTSTTLTLTGVAATGGAIAGQIVDARCATGVGQSTTGADGSYTILITNGALPCVMRVVRSGGSALYSLAQGSGTSATAQITPVSDLIVAQLTAAEPAALFDNFSAAKVTPAAVTAATTAVVGMLADGGTDFTAVGDPLTATLVAANGSQAGNAFDAQLDALGQRMAQAGTTQSTLTAAVVASASGSQGQGSGVASLPPDMLLRPAASGCTALRTGEYQLALALSGLPNTERVHVDAQTLVITNARGETLPMTDMGDCHFIVDFGASEVTAEELAVSPSGAIAVRWETSGAFSSGLMLPVQTHTLAEMAGDWSGMGMDRTSDNGPVHLTRSNLTMGSDGHPTALTFCDELIGACSPADANQLTPLTLAEHADGGFTWSHAIEGWSDRFFAYRSGSGQLLGVNIAPAGHLSVRTRTAPLALPAVNDESRGWLTRILPNSELMLYITIPVMEAFRQVVTSVDAAASSYVQQANVDPDTTTTRPETLVINQPAMGYAHRLPGVVTDSTGLASHVIESVSLELTGMGMTATGI